MTEQSQKNGTMALSSFHFDEFKIFLEEFDIEEFLEKINKPPNPQDLKKKLLDYTNPDALSTRSILGIDIYKYSKYPTFEQILIPVIFQILYEKAIDYSINNNKFVFQNTSEEIIKEQFISTGDGGFQIFDTPLHAILFAINFAIILREYNSYHFYPKLRTIAGEIDLRYAVTLDEIYQFDNNFFGSAIINNARIISKDSLNRCLIDQNSFDWFMMNSNGIENIQYYKLSDLLEIEEFSNYNRNYLYNEEKDNYLLHDNPESKHGIIACDIQKIGDIAAKEQRFSIYNLFVKCLIRTEDILDKSKRKDFIVSLGNLNSIGF